MKKGREKYKSMDVECKLCEEEKDVNVFPETGLLNFYLCADCVLKLRRLNVARMAREALKMKKEGRDWRQLLP